MTKSEEALPIESDERRETIGLSNLLPPPLPIRDIRVIRGYFLYAGTSGSSGGSRPSSSSSFNGSPAGITFTVILEVLLSDQAPASRQRRT